MIVLYSTGCPRCKTLKMLLDKTGETYTVIDSVEEMLKLGIKTAPALEVNGKIYEYTEAVSYVKSIR